MSDFKLLLVEDDEEAIRLCQVCVVDFEKERNCSIKLYVCKSGSEAFEVLDNTFDGAIIDLRLAEQGDEGNQVVSRIEESHFRIPVAILTGTPDAADSDFSYIGIFKKGDPGAGYNDLLEHFWGIHNTGLTRIMGGRGIIEKTLNKVFRENLLPQRDTWVEYGETDSAKTEKALLRHALNHLLQLLVDDGDRSFPEEMYLYPPLTAKIRTGSIVKQKDINQWLTVMNPACDLVTRDGAGFKTERILLAEIEPIEKVIEIATKKCVDVSEKEEKLKVVFCNNYTTYHHWLPETSFFVGGFLNFRKLSTYKKKDFEKKFDKPDIQISPLFVKDVIARFSSYYARQGQPDIDYTAFVTQLATTQEMETTK
jgi:CheY-like chemotaxis protein